MMSLSFPQLRRPDRDDATTLRLPGSREIIAAIRSELRFLNMIFFAISGTSVALLIAAGVTTVAAQDADAGVVRLFYGGLIAGLPAVPLQVVGHFGAAAWARPALPHDTAEQIAEANRGPIHWAKAVGVVSFTGAALYGIYHLSQLTAELGFDERLFGLIPPAWLIPFSVEALLLFVLFMKMSREADLAALVPRAAAYLTTEINEEIGRQQLLAEANLTRLEAEAKGTALEVDANQKRRQADHLAAVEEEKFRAARGSRRRLARDQAAQEVELDQIEAAAVLAERRFETEERIAALTATAELNRRRREMEQRQAELDHQALLATTEDRQALATAKARDHLQLDQDRHQAQLNKTRRKERLLPSGSSSAADPKAPDPEPTSVLHTPVDVGTNGKH